jgi:hypothetical protein
MNNQPTVPPVIAVQPRGQLGRIGMIFALTAAAALGSGFVFRPG